MIFIRCCMSLRSLRRRSGEPGAVVLGVPWFVIVCVCARGGEGYLEVRVSNEAAIGLYDVLGFRKVKRNYGYYMDGEDAWVMAVSLAGF
jgi:hypothetical protein